jgi:hypothetical protein
MSFSHEPNLGSFPLDRLWRLRHNTGFIWQKSQSIRLGGPNTLRNPGDFESFGVNLSPCCSPKI